MTPEELARAMNALTPEQIARAMERLDTPTLEWAVKFEALSETEAELLAGEGKP